MNDEQYNVIFRNLPTTIGGFVKKQDDFYTIILNARMTRERNQESFMDEIDHIQADALDSELTADQIELMSHSRKEKQNGTIWK